MKVKLDFITNSSSISYIVCAPNWLELSFEDKDVKYAADLYSDRKTSSESLFKMMVKLLKQLKNNKLISSGDLKHGEWLGYYSLCTFFNSSTYEITNFETGPGGGFIENISIEKLNNIFLSVNRNLIESSFKFLKKGEKSSATFLET